MFNRRVNGRGVDLGASPCQYGAMPDVTAIPESVWVLLSGVSVLMFIGSLLALRYLIIRMPADYFLRDHRRGANWFGDHAAMRILATVLKNALGILLVGLGAIMLFTPGQGVLLILVGVSLLDVPGKRTIELRIVGIHTVRRAIDRIRANAKRPPIELPDSAGDGGAAAREARGG